MFNSSRLAAGEFVDSQTKRRHIRVFYQNKNNDIRESCFDTDNGWHTRADQLVFPGTLAMAKSPIAVTFWNAGRETRVYFLDSEKKIRERTRTTTSPDTPGQWVDGTTITASILPGSQLAVARSGDGDNNIRLFYQAQDETIHQTMYKKKDGKWTERATTFPKVYSGSGLAAVVAKKSGQMGEVRLFYQGTDKKLKEHYMNTNGDWSASTSVPSYDLVAGASISAVNWGVDTTSPNLQIRVFSIDNKGFLQIMSYDASDDGWDYTPSQVAATTTTKTLGDSGVAAAQGPDENGTVLVDVFYQPESKTIGQFKVNYTKRAELGIPTSI
ncbi:hypothetical protein ACMFMG_001102 [Clarireedia jacksonii]